jgi:ribose transport system permease protein
LASLFNNVVPVATIIFIVFAALATAVLNTTRFGRYVLPLAATSGGAHSGVPSRWSR